MAERNTATKGTRRSAKSAGGEASGTFTDEEKAAARERVKELKRAPRADQADGERGIRRYFRNDRGLPPDSLVTRGYWRLGEANHPDHDYGDDEPAS